MLIIFKLIFAYFGVWLAKAMGENAGMGMLVGLFFGHIMDHIAGAKFREWRMKKAWTQQAHQIANSRFFSSLFTMLGKLCAVDGSIAKEEVQAVDKFILEVLSLKKKERGLAIQYFKAARHETTPFQKLAVDFFEIYQSEPQVLERTLGVFFSIALADGKLAKEEEKLIQTAATVFGIDTNQYQNIKRSYISNGQSYYSADSESGAANESKDPLSKSYEILGCSERDSVDDIKRQYRKLVSQYHPDKIVSKDLPKDFLDFAHKKFKTIQSAYDLVKAERKFN